MNILNSDVSKWFVLFWHRNPDKDLTFIQQARFSWPFGKYWHVSAFGYSRQANCWIHFNPERRGMGIALAAEGYDAQNMLSILLRCGDVIEIEPKISNAFFTRGIFTCVTAIKHLIGLRCGALTPNQLYRKLQEIGTECLDGQKCDQSSPSDVGVY